MSHAQTPYVGALTAPINSPVPMTVNAVHYREENGEQVLDLIECLYFVGAKLHHHSSNDVDSFIGFGEDLAFSSGAFQYAFNNRVDDESDDEDDEDDGLDTEGGEGGLDTEEDLDPASPVR